MWHWIQNALSKKRQQFFFDILIFVSCIHIIIVVCAALYQSKRAVEQVSLVAPDIRGSTLVFVPLYKKIEQPKSQTSTSSIQKPHHQMNYDEFLDRQKKAVSAKKSVVQKKPVAQKPAPQKKVEPAKAAAQKSGAQKIALQKSAEKKNIGAQVSKPAATSLSNESVKPKNASAKKVVAAKLPAAKKAQEKMQAAQVLVEKKQEIVQEAVIKKSVEKALPEQVKEPEKEKILEEKIPEQLIAEQLIAEQKIAEQKIAEVVPQEIQEDKILNTADQQENVLPLIDMNDVTFVGVKDLEHLQLQQIISGQLAKHWKRPVGMENKMCVVKIELHATGKIINAHIEKSSGVPMYDMAAKAAALKTIYPQEIWNKKLVIQF